MGNTLFRTALTRPLIFMIVFLISFSGLILQIALTRIFSTVAYYHFAFIAISVALFGWGFGGTLLHFLKQRLHTVTISVAFVFLIAYSLSLPTYLFTLMSFRFSQSHMGFLYAASLIPFFLAGTSLAFFYSELPRSANKLYLVDLAGAGFACLAVEPMLVLFGAESTVLFVGVIGSIVCVSLALSMERRTAIVLSFIILTLSSALLTLNLQSGMISVSNPDKVMFKLLQSNPDLRVTLTKWNSFSRIDVVEGFEGVLKAIIYIDAGASTDILRWSGSVEDLQYLKKDFDFLPYCLVDSPKTLIIGSGGGRDVLVALAGNSSRITAVELNPIVIEAVERYKEETADFYNNQKVELHVDEGRSFIKRSNETFDIITLTLVDSWAAISAGGYTLAENYLYTKEAFVDYISHLNDNGFLIMVRWEPEIPRLISTAAEALATLGENPHDVGKHIAVILHYVEPGIVRALFVLRKRPFTFSETQTVVNLASTLEPACSLWYVPDMKTAGEPYDRFFNGSLSLEEFCSAFPYRVDDSPYFFNIEKPIPRTLTDLTELALPVAGLSIIIPWVVEALARRRKNTAKSVGSNFRFNRYSLILFVVFFSMLGLGYMLIEIAIVQKFILFLGYPTRSLTVVLFSLLLSSGIGSLASGHFASSRRHLIRNVLVASIFVFLITSIYMSILPEIFELLLASQPLIRIVVAAILIFPLGVWMGVPFPSGIRLLHEVADENIPWMWGVNGSMSVFGTILASVVGITLGFGYAIIFGALAYLIAFLCAAIWLKQK
jgi:hypothetical protein